MEPKPPWPDGAPWMRDRGPRRRRSPVFVAVLFAAIQVTGGLIASRHTGGLDSLAAVLLVVGPAGLLLRRRQPLVGYAVALAATIAYLVLGFPGGPFFLAALIALSAAVKRGPRAAVWGLTALGYLSYVLLTAYQLVIAGRALAHPSLGGYLAAAAWTAVALALTEVNGVRGKVFAEMARTQAESTRARQEQSRRQASDERLRIARELHDVLGHHLSLINVRAGVALHLLDSQPEQARDALGAIKLASAEALREVRTVLAALNPDDEAPPRSPAPGLADLDRLLQDARDAGLTVHIERTGLVRPPPGEVDRAAYRIVQEALTNVRRHAGPGASVTVVLGYRQKELAVRVDDTGTGPQPSTSDGLSGPPGNGIPGMRERAVALGGTLTADAGPGGGFRIEAWLPLPDVPAASAPPSPPAQSDPTTSDPTTSDRTNSGMTDPDATVSRASAQSYLAEERT